MHITFSNPGDLTDKSNRDRIFAIIERFANSKHGMGNEGIDCWLYEFNNFLKNYNKQSLDSLERDKFFKTVEYFLSLQEYAQYTNDLHWTNTSGQLNITAFRALVGMVNFSTALNQIETVHMFRKIARDYPNYNISTFQRMWVFVDQYEGFTPTNGLGWIERRVIEQQFPHSDGTFTPARALSWEGECDLVVSAKDNGNILRPAYRKAVIKLNDFVMSNVSVTVDDMEYSYKNICLKFLQFCHTNPQIYVFDMMLSSPQPNDNLTYPMARSGNRRFYIANTLGEVEVSDKNFLLKLFCTSNEM